MQYSHITCKPMSAASRIRVNASTSAKYTSAMRRSNSAWLSVSICKAVEARSTAVTETRKREKTDIVNIGDISLVKSHPICIGSCAKIKNIFSIYKISIRPLILYCLKYWTLMLNIKALGPNKSLVWLPTCKFSKRATCLV